MTTTAELTRYLERTFGAARPPMESLHWTSRWHSPGPADVSGTVVAYADVVRADIASGAIQLGSWLSTDDGRLIATAVAAMSPPPTRPYEQLLVRALVEVASEQTNRRRQNAALAGAGLASLGLIFVVTRVLSAS